MLCSHQLQTKAGNTKAAEEYLLESLDIKTSSVSSALLGLLYMQQSRPIKAITHLSKALYLMPYHQPTSEDLDPSLWTTLSYFVAVGMAKGQINHFLLGVKSDMLIKE